MTKNILLVLLFSSLYLKAGPQAAIHFKNAENDACSGVFIDSIDSQIMATVAHCLSNFTDGGLTLPDNSTSIEVWVHDQIKNISRKNGDKIPKEYDFALVRFAAHKTRKTSPIYSGLPLQKLNVPLKTVVFNAGKFHEAEVEFKGYIGDPSGTFDLFINTTNTLAPAPKLDFGDSGTPLFNSDAQGAAMGLLRGCELSDIENCGFISLTLGNPNAQSVLQKAKTYLTVLTMQPPTHSKVNKLDLDRLVREITLKEMEISGNNPPIASPTIPLPSPVPELAPIPQPQAQKMEWYLCEGKCEVTYYTPPQVLNGKVSEASFKANSQSEAETIVRPVLVRECDDLGRKPARGEKYTIRVTSVTCNISPYYRR